MALEAWDRLINAILGLPTASDTIKVDLRRGLTIQFAAISAANAGANTVVAADATRKIKVLDYTMVSEGTVTTTWQSSGGTSLSGAMPLVVNTGVSAGGGNAPATHWEFETVAAEGLVLTLSGATGIRGHLTYFLES